MTSPRPKYQPGPDDVAALSLGDDGDTDTDTRRAAVEACLGSLQRHEGLGTLSTANLRATAWEVDGGETAATPSEAWESYVRPSLNALDTVSSPSPGRYRYSGPSERVENPDRLAESNTQQALDVSPENDPLLAALSGGTDARAALSAGERDELARCEMVANMMDLSVRDVRRKRLENNDVNSPAASAADAGSDHDRNTDAAAALGTIDRGPTPTPNEPADVDPTNPEDRARMAGAQAQLEHNARKRAAGGETDGNAALAASSNADVDHGQGREKCVRCEDAPAEVDAPGVHNARFNPGDRLCRGCFKEVALGNQ